MLAPTKTALERLLQTERHRRQASQSTIAGFAAPVLAERALGFELEPLVVSNARGQLVPTKVSRARGVARVGLFECPLQGEGAFLLKAFNALWEISAASGWRNRCSSLAEASAKMQSEPKTIIVPYGLVQELSTLTRDEADALMRANGYVTKGAQQILVGELPAGSAIVAGAPEQVGYYTRIDERLGVMLTQADRTLMLVRGRAA